MPTQQASQFDRKKVVKITRGSSRDASLFALLSNGEIWKFDAVKNEWEILPSVPGVLL